MCIPRSISQEAKKARFTSSFTRKLWNDLTVNGLEWSDHGMKWLQKCLCTHEGWDFYMDFVIYICSFWRSENRNTVWYQFRLVIIIMYFTMHWPCYSSFSFSLPSSSSMIIITITIVIIIINVIIIIIVLLIITVIAIIIIIAWFIIIIIVITVSLLQPFWAPWLLRLKLVNLCCYPASDLFSLFSAWNWLVKWSLIKLWCNFSRSGHNLVWK